MSVPRRPLTQLFLFGGLLMNDFYASTPQLFYQIANGFFWPLAIALLTLSAVSLLDPGRMAVVAWRRARLDRARAFVRIGPMRRLSAHSVAVLCGVLMLNCAAGAQTNSATLSGTVRDNTGGVVPDVAITVSSAATGLKRQATTNGEGIFTLPLLPPGRLFAAGPT